MIGQTILHYKITGKLGAGGMGEVFLATHPKLGRQVALKFLPASVSSDPTARERFLREARAASQLSHPNVVALYYIEETDDRDFIVMEYVAGRSLREVISDSDIPLPTAVSHTALVADCRPWLGPIPTVANRLTSSISLNPSENQKQTG